MTDQERVAEALDRAAEQVEEGCGCQDCTLHAGWAEAVRELVAHDCTYRTEEREEAIRRFCDAMLGAEQSDAHLCPVGGDPHVPVPGICDHA